MKNSKKFITQAQMEAMCLNFNKEVSFTGVTFANVIYKNDVSGSRTINKQKALQKTTEVQITLGADYTKKVQRIEVKKQGAESSDFEAQKMNGKSYTNGIENPVVHADKNPDFRMLVMIVEHSTKRKSTYFHNGEIITIEKATELDLLTPSFFTSRPSAGRGIVNEENNFDFNTLGFDKILQITINKVDYIIIK